MNRESLKYTRTNTNTLKGMDKHTREIRTQERETHTHTHTHSHTSSHKQKPSSRGAPAVIPAESVKLTGPKERFASLDERRLSLRTRGGTQVLDGRGNYLLKTLKCAVNSENAITFFIVFIKFQR